MLFIFNHSCSPLLFPLLHRPVLSIFPNSLSPHLQASPPHFHARYCTLIFCLSLFSLLPPPSSVKASPSPSPLYSLLPLHFFCPTPLPSPVLSLFHHSLPPIPIFFQPSLPLPFHPSPVISSLSPIQPLLPIFPTLTAPSFSHPFLPYIPQSVALPPTTSTLPLFLPTTLPPSSPIFPYSPFLFHPFFHISFPSSPHPPSPICPPPCPLHSLLFLLSLPLPSFLPTPYFTPPLLPPTFTLLVSSVRFLFSTPFSPSPFSVTSNPSLVLSLVPTPSCPHPHFRQPQLPPPFSAFLFYPLSFPTTSSPFPYFSQPYCPLFLFPSTSRVLPPFPLPPPLPTPSHPLPTPLSLLFLLPPLPSLPSILSPSPLPLPFHIFPPPRGFIGSPPLPHSSPSIPIFIQPSIPLLFHPSLVYFLCFPTPSPSSPSYFSHTYCPLFSPPISPIFPHSLAPPQHQRSLFFYTSYPHSLPPLHVLPPTSLRFSHTFPLFSRFPSLHFTPPYCLLLFLLSLLSLPLPLPYFLPTPYFSLPSWPSRFTPPLSPNCLPLPHSPLPFPIFPHF